MPAKVTRRARVITENLEIIFEKERKGKAGDGRECVVKGKKATALG